MQDNIECEIQKQDKGVPGCDLLGTSLKTTCAYAKLHAEPCVASHGDPGMNSGA